MAKDIAVVAIHGMGDTERTYDAKLRSRLRKRIGDSRWARVAWKKVYYQDVLQANQRRYMRESLNTADLDWVKLRKFVLFGFSDAAGMESRPHLDNSVYQRIQQKVLDTLDDAMAALGDPTKPVIFIAHSLGCQVLSNYIWDAQQSQVDAGVFRQDLPNPIGKTSPEDKFRRLKTLRWLFTSGCNIPIFVAGLPKTKIKPIVVNARGWRIRWENYFDPDDALGWPLHPLSPAYEAAVAIDESINVGGPLNSWTPMSHTAYWKDDDFLDPVEHALRVML